MGARRLANRIKVSAIQQVQRQGGRLANIANEEGMQPNGIPGLAHQRRLDHGRKSG
jgi:hypothetical protein